MLQVDLTPPPAQTFAEARAKHLQRLEEVFARLRRLAADRHWFNPESGQAMETREQLDGVLSALTNLNNAEREAE